MARLKVTCRTNRAFPIACVLSLALGLLLVACTTGSDAGPMDAASGSAPTAISLAAVPTATPSASDEAAALLKGVLASIATKPGDAPVAAVSGFGSVWVPSHRGARLYRIDPKTNRTFRIDMGQDCFNAAQVGFGHVFAACEDGEVVVDPKTEQVVGSSDCGQYLSFSPDAIWSAGPDGIQRCSPTTFQRTKLYKVGDGYSGTAFGFGSVWAANGLQHTVTRLDPATGEVIKSIPADGISDGDFDCHVLVAFGAVWNQCDPGDKIYRIDPANNTVKVFHVKARALTDFYVRPLVAGLGSLWLTTSLIHVTRFDPKTMKVLGRYPVDPSGLGSGAITIAGGSLWLTNPEADSIWRDRVEP